MEASSLPSGTVTFLLTDIEGSTRLLQHLGEAQYAQVLAEHHRLLRAAFEQTGGQEIDNPGDGFAVVFASARDAVMAAIAAQLALACHAWPEGIEVRVRMGLHTGEPTFTGSGYVGLDLHRAARISAAGHGGQVLLSQTTRDLVEQDRPEGVSLRALGSHRLKDLIQPERLYQLLIEDLPADFPPLKSLDARPHNLPAQLTPLIGREKELAAVCDLLRQEAGGRLVTLTGPGGTGKTRLGLQVAAELLEVFSEGVFFVGLAPISDPGLVVGTIAQTLGVREGPGQTLAESLQEYLRDRQMLLVLDNFEQVLAAAPRVSELLAHCSRLKVLVTSRAALRLRGEHEFPVPPLALPDLKQIPDVISLSQYAAVELFIQRALQVKRDFTVTNENAPAVAEICHRLDGLPLAIEMAAARVKLLPLAALQARLERRLPVLTGGARDLPARQQTLRNTIAWSYDLLDDEGKALFRRLSVFVGGCSLEAAEAVCNLEGDLPVGVLEGLTSLIDQSLLQQEEGLEGDPRFTMLGTIQEHGRECLEEGSDRQALGSSESGATRRQHAQYYVSLAEQAGPELFRQEQVAWLQRLEREHGNLRAALDWCLTHGEVEAGLRACGSVWRFWFVRGHRAEGRERLAAFLARPEAQVRTPARAKALDGAGVLALIQGDFASARSCYEEMLAIGHDLEDSQILAIALNGLGHIALLQREIDQGRHLFEQALELAREAGDRWEVAFSLHCLGILACFQGDNSAAWPLLEEAMAMRRELGDKTSMVTTLNMMAYMARGEGDYRVERALQIEQLTIARELGPPLLAGVLGNLGRVARVQGDYAAARAYGEEALAIAQERRQQWGLAASLQHLGWIALEQRYFEAACCRFEESLVIWRELGDCWASYCLQGLGDVRRYQGDFAAARALYEEGLALWRDLKEDEDKKRATAGLLLSLGIVVQMGLDSERAAALYRESLTLCRDVRDKPETAACIEALGGLAGVQGQPRRAARLLGAAAALRETIGAPLPPVDRPAFEGGVAAVNAALGDSAFAAAWAQGRSMSLDEVVVYALEETDDA